MNALTSILTRSLTTIALVSLCQCARFTKPPAGDTRPVVTPNHIDSNAIHFKARYGTEYEIQGNVIAEYPDFNLTLHKTTSDKNNKITSTYQLASKTNGNVAYIDITSQRIGRKHFYLEGTHYYYHCNKPQTINIYIPSQLLAFSMNREQ